MGVYVVTYRALPRHPVPGYVEPVAFLIAAIPAALAVAQFSTRFRRSRRVTLYAVAVDSVAVLAILFVTTDTPTW